MSYTNIFGGTPVQPSQPSYEALTISANTALVWPLEATGATPYAAAAIDVTATAGSLLLMMPPGNTGSAGVISMVTNVGSNSFTVTDQAGNAIAPIAPTQSWLLILRSNTTANGSWGAIQMGATAASATSAALAGPGLAAVGALLETNRVSVSLSASTLLTNAYRSQAVTWTGTTGTLTLDTIANLTAGWECLINNSGTNTLTIACSGGATVNGAATFVMQPGNSGILVCGSGGFLTFGAIVTSLAIAVGGTGASSATAALTNLGGTSIGKSIFTAPSAASVLALLGISNTAAFFEATVSSNQSPNTSVGGTVFICTMALTITLPLTTTLTNHYVLIISATNGAVTIAPQAADKINGGSIGVSVTVASGNSTFLITDANGNWYTVFQGVQTITLSGDVTGTGTTAITTTVAKISGVSVTLGGAFTTVGAHILTLTTTANTSVTLPTAGTLIPADGGTYSISISGTAAAASAAPWSGITGIPANVSGINQSVAIGSSPSFSNPIATGAFLGYGYRINQGQGNNFGGNTYNIWWDGSFAYLYIDSTNIGSFAYTSDAAIKQNIEAAPDSSTIIAALRPVIYELRDHEVFTADGIRRWGFVADEVLVTLPSAVHIPTDQPDALKSIDPMPIIAALTDQVQRLMKRVAILETRTKKRGTFRG